MTRTECYLALNSIRLIGPVRVKKLLEAFGSVESIFLQSSSQLCKIDGISKTIAQSILDWEKNWNLKEELEKIQKLGLTILDRGDEKYPKTLLDIYDPPLVLYCKGDVTALAKRSIAIVGSRNTSTYGFETARKLAYQCAYSGLCVVSGLAKGIDTAAHQGALAAKGKTVAVFGSSLDHVYPTENRVLADKIIEEGGIWISEFSLGTPPDRQTFPMRNRIVSGLSEGVLVVEAGKDSGALITARVASEQGKQVFAVPGRIDQPHAKGCHQLIKQGAKLVEGVEDIFAEFEFLFPSKQVKPEKRLPEVEVSDEERQILDAMGEDETSLDVIIRKSGLPSGSVFSSLLRLELKKMVRQLPGKNFVKTY
jgi:DNA processing protein